GGYTDQRNQPWKFVEEMFGPSDSKTGSSEIGNHSGYCSLSDFDILSRQPEMTVVAEEENGFS
ncbi:hypothetical protein Csa_023550, partial [Cucumis sativus]